MRKEGMVTMRLANLYKNENVQTCFGGILIVASLLVLALALWAVINFVSDTFGPYVTFLR
jgi:nitrogen fixation/metabolism regulation signal transduction histidine kinase